jgi:outer membrane protein assembly factor BamA
VRMVVLVLVAAVIVGGGAPASAQTADRIVEIRVHGNHTTSNDDVLALSGLAVGEPGTEARLKEAEDKLTASHRFESVEVRRRFQSISDPTAILVMIVVDERAGVSSDTPIPGPLRRLRVASLWMPILKREDGYGFTYGARVSFTDPLGRDTRLSFPLTWGGERRAGVEAERTFKGPILSSVTGGVSTYRTVNPHYDIADVRLEAGARVERRFAHVVRAGAHVRTARVDFAGAAQRHDAAGVDVRLDTRLDPSFPRNAMDTRIGWERLGFESGSAGIWRGDLRGYIGVFGANVLALRATFARADAALPISEQPLLGGSDTLRGYRAGYRAGDSLAAASVEVRVPLTSPLNYGRFGVKGFIDTGTVWSSSARLRDQPFDRGIGGGVYAGVAAFMLNIDVAWPESGSPRVHVGMGVTF